MPQPDSIYQCSSCGTAYVGLPQGCRWCWAPGAFNRIGSTTNPFDFVVSKEQRKLTPEKFGDLSKLVDGLLKRRVSQSSPSAEAKALPKKSTGPSSNPPLSS